MVKTINVYLKRSAWTADCHQHWTWKHQEHINVIYALIRLMYQKVRTILPCGQSVLSWLPHAMCTLPDSGPNLWKGTVQLFPCSTMPGQCSISLCWHAPKNDISMVITFACLLSQASRGILSEVLSEKIWSGQLSVRKPTNKHKIWKIQNYFISIEREGEWPEPADLEWQINRGYPHLLNWQGACFFDDSELRNQQKNPDYYSADKSVSIFYILLSSVFSVLISNISS